MPDDLKRAAQTNELLKNEGYFEVHKDVKNLEMPNPSGGNHMLESFNSVQLPAAPAILQNISTAQQNSIVLYDYIEMQKKRQQAKWRQLKQQQRQRLKRLNTGNTANKRIRSKQQQSKRKSKRKKFPPPKSDENYTSAAATAITLSVYRTSCFNNTNKCVIDLRGKSYWNIWCVGRQS